MIFLENYFPETGFFQENHYFIYSNCSAMVMSSVHQVWPNPSCKAQNEKRKKTRQTEEEMGRPHQGMGRPGVRQVPEGSGEQGKMEETGCEIICGALMTLVV